MKVSDFLVKSLEEQGVKCIFGIGGEEVLPMLESLRNSQIKYISTRHEQSAAFMAATCGRLTGIPGVVLSTLGPGATNLVTGIAHAQLGGIPLIAITAQKPTEEDKEGLFQSVDISGIMAKVAKESISLRDLERISAKISSGILLATQGRPGAVHLELPVDIASLETAVDITSFAESGQISSDPEQISSLVELIKTSKRPLILIGSGANRGDVSDSLTRFIDKTCIYFVTTQMGRGVVDERSSKYLGCLAVSKNDYPNCAVDMADLILCVGHDSFEKAQVLIDSGVKQIVHLNTFSDQGSSSYAPSFSVVGDIASTLDNLNKAFLSSGVEWNLSEFEKVRTDLLDELSPVSLEAGGSVTPLHLVDQVRKAVPEDGIVALDNGLYKLWFARYYPTYHHDTLLVDNTLATMGAGLPSAIAAKLLNQDRKVVAVCGDGGFMMSVAELETAVRLNLDLVVIVLNDNGLGMVRWEQSVKGYPDFGLTQANPDFVKLAESFGARGYHLERGEELGNTLKKAVEAQGVNLIEIPVDYSQSSELFTELLRESVC